MKEKNLAAELLRKLLNEQIAFYQRTNFLNALYRAFLLGSAGYVRTEPAGKSHAPPKCLISSAQYLWE